jgi:signal transduction histidine kinase
MTLVPVNVLSCVRLAIGSANLPAGILIHIEGLENLPDVIAGERNLVLVFTNLLENAANAMQGQGTITIRGCTKAEMVEIDVNDNGSGIPPELHDRIFEFHYSGRASVHPDNLGFGLWWIKTVMARLGGSISVESDGVQGSTFHLLLPSSQK